MAVQQVRALINGTWTVLTYNSSSGKYEATIAAPNITSYNVNAGHYYPVTIEATDQAGNMTTKNDSDSTLGNNLKLIVKEVTKPTIAITSPSTGSYLTNNMQPISFQLRDEVSGSGIAISSLKFKIDSGAVLTNTSPGMNITSVSGGYDVIYTPQTVLADGVHNIYIDINDNDGNVAIQATISFTVDTVPPVLTVSNPINETTYTNVATLNVAGTTSDSTSSPVVVTIKLNGVDQGAVTVQGNGSFTKSVTLANGTNTLIIRTTDKANKYTEITRTMVLDTVAPVVGSIAITPNPVNTGQSYLIAVSVTD
jgi:hypothetical protein